MPAEPVFEVTVDKAGKYRFRLKASNGQIIATSEAYESKDSCMNGIESVKKNAPKASVKEIQ
ncbi:MAG: YegP family protein [Candidatus Methanomethylicus sp.]|nr:YegP family protein [Candidatus Methanomethylicus sp.]